MTTHAIPQPEPLTSIVHRAMRAVPRRRRDLVSEITIVGAAALATAGFVVASIVDAMLLPRPRRRRSRGT